MPSTLICEEGVGFNSEKPWALPLGWTLLNVPMPHHWSLNALRIWEGCDSGSRLNVPGMLFKEGLISYGSTDMTALSTWGLLASCNGYITSTCVNLLEDNILQSQDSRHLQNVRFEYLYMITYRYRLQFLLHNWALDHLCTFEAWDFWLLPWKSHFPKPMVLVPNYLPFKLYSEVRRGLNELLHQHLGLFMKI